MAKGGALGGVEGADEGMAGVGRGGTPMPVSRRRSCGAVPGGGVPGPVAGASSSGLRRLNTRTPYLDVGAAGAEPDGIDTTSAIMGRAA